ncbi:MAG: hypothetical protein ACFFG0_19970 [Candidatus Thorarchaeota archaeon]
MSLAQLSNPVLTFCLGFAFGWGALTLIVFNAKKRGEIIFIRDD